MSQLPYCIHRGQEVRPDHFECHSDRLVHSGVVSANVCMRCPYANKPLLKDTGLGDTIHRATYYTGLAMLSEAMSTLIGTCGCSKRKRWLNNRFKYKGRSHRKFMGDWAVAVTTAPRPLSTLAECLTSIVTERWAPWIFAEPETELAGCEAFQVTQHTERFGAWRNWVFACRTLLSETTAPWILTVQDDVVFTPGTRAYCERSSIPENAGMASLYTPSHYAREQQGWNRVSTHSLWGACAMWFRRETLQELLDHPRALSWGGAPFRTRTRPREPWEVGNVDTAVGKILRAMKRPTYFVSPSLCQHVSTTSAMGHGGNHGKRRAKEVGIPNA